LRHDWDVHKRKEAGVKFVNFTEITMRDVPSQELVCIFLKDVPRF